MDTFGKIPFMKKISILLLFVGSGVAGFAQEGKHKKTTPETQVAPVYLDVNAIDVAISPPEAQVVPAKDEVFIHVEEMPSFPGGIDKMHAFIQKHKKYPQGGPDADKEGKVFVAFIVKSDGRIEDIKVKRSLSPSHDAAAIRIIKMMPKWIPAKQNGRAVNCWYTLPIDFYFL